jgi:hypothetical protein
MNELKCLGLKLVAVHDNGFTWELKVSPGSGRGALPAGFDPWEAEPPTNPDDYVASLATPAGAQLCIAMLIKKSRAEIEAGDAIQLLHAVSWVIEYGMVAPEWLANLFKARFQRFQNEECTLDEAFGLPRQTERERKTSIDHKQLRPKVARLLAMELASDPKLRIENDLYERVGEALGIGREQCRKIYKEAVSVYGFQDLKALKRLLVADRKLRAKSKVAG